MTLPSMPLRGAASLTEDPEIANRLRSMSHRPNLAQVFRTLTITMLTVCVVAAQPRLAAGVVSAWAANDSGCSDCPCEGAAELAATANRDENAANHNSDGCPEGGCPVGCDECTCCPGVTPGVTSSLAWCLDVDPVGELLAAGVEKPLSHLPERLFKPPRASCG